MDSSLTEASGPAFAREVQKRLAGVPGLKIEVGQTGEDDSRGGAYLVDISWSGGSGLLCETVDWADGVRVMDPHAEDVSVDMGIRYIQARATGASPRHAWRFAQAEH